MSAEGVLTITALFQDNATAGLQGLNTQLTATASAASQAESGFSPLNNILGTTSTEAGAAAGTMGPLGNVVRESGTAAETTVPGFVGMGNALGTTGTAARGIVEPMGALSGSFGGVAKGGLEMSNTLQPIPGVFNQGGQAAGGFGNALKSNALAISAVAATAVGLVTGLTSIEKAHVMVERSQVMLTTAQIMAQRTQDLLTLAIQKYGPASEQAKLASENHAKAVAAVGVAQDRAKLTQDRYNEVISEFATQIAPQVIMAGGGIVQILSGMGISFSDITGAIGSFKTEIRDAFIAMAGSITGIVPGITNLGTAAEQATIKMKLLSGAMTVGIAAGIVAAFFAIGQAIASNSSAVQGFFDKIANAIPSLKLQITSAGEAIVGFGTYSRDALKIFTDSIHLTTNAYTPLIAKHSELVAAFVAGNRDMTFGQQGQIKAQIAWANQQGISTQQYIANLKKIEASQALVDTATQHTAEVSATAWKAFQDGANTALNNVDATMKNFTTELTAGIERSTGIIPGLSNAFGTAAATIVEFEGEITAGMKAMEKDGFSTTAIVSFGVTTGAALQNVKAAVVSAGGVMRTDWITANQLAQQVAAGHTEKLGELEQKLQALGIDFKSAAMNSDATLGSFFNLNDSARLVGQSMDTMGQGTKTATEIMAAAIGNINNAMDQGKTKMAEWILMSGGAGKAAQANAIEGKALSDVYGNLAQAQDKGIAAGSLWVTTFVSADKIQKMTKESLAALVMQHEKYVPPVKASAKSTEDFATALNAELKNLSEATTKEEATTAATMKFTAANGFAAKGIADAAKAYADAASKNEELTAQLTNGTAKINLYNAAVMDGKNKFMEFELATKQAVVTDREYSNELGTTVDKLGFLRSGLEATVKNEELFYKATQGDVTAMQELKKQALDLLSGFTQLADQVGNKLGQAMQKGQKEFETAMKEIEKSTGITFDPQQKFALSVQAEIDNAKTDLATGISAMAAIILNGGGNVGTAGAALMAHLKSEMQGASPAVIATFQKVVTDIQNMANKPISFGALQQLKTDMAAVGIPADKLDSVIQSLGIHVAGAAPAFTKLSAAAQTVANNFKTMGDTVNTSSGEVTNAAGQIIGKIDLTTGSFTKYSAGVSAAVDLNKGFATGVDDAAGSLNKLKQYTDTVFTAMLPSIEKAATAMNKTFNTAVQDAAGSLNNLQNKVSAVFDAILKVINTDMTSAARDFVTQTGKMLSTVNTDFAAIERNINTDITGAARDVNTQMVAATRTVTTETGKMLSAVNTAFGAILRNINSDMTNAANDVKSKGSAIISEFNAIGSSALSQISKVDSLRNAINSLQSRSVTLTLITRYVSIGSPSGVGGFNTAVGGASGAGGETNAISNTQSVTTVNAQPITVLVQVDGKTLARVVKKNMFNLTSGVT